MGPLAVTAGLSVADQILGFIGVNPTDIGNAFLRILSGGDKKQRLRLIEMMGLQAVQSAALTLKAIEGKTDEVAVAVRDQQIASLSATIAMIVKTADLDGSADAELPR